jgi:hypothetical protein
MLSPIQQNRQSGQTLSEYSLGIALVAILSLTALSNLGGNLKVAFKQMIPKAAPSAIVNTMPTTNNPTNAPNGSVKLQTGSSNGNIAGNFSESVIEPHDYTTRLTGTVTTLGANGTTFQLANQVKALGEKMLASGEITETEANKLYALANQGYRLAELEKQVEDASKRNSSTGDFLGSSISFDGKNYTIPEVAGLIGFGTPTDLTQDIKKNSNYMLETADASPETLAFIQLYQDAISVPGLQNSEAKGVISQLSSEISYLTDAISNLIYGAYDPNITLENLNKNTVSVATVYDSTSLCYVGNGKSDAASCK